MTKQQKLDAIYEAMADKTLSYGCKITTADKDYGLNVEAITIKKIEWITSWSWYDKTDDCVSVYIPFGWRGNSGKYKPMVSFAKNKMKIIWHPVRIGDVLDFFDKIIFRVESEEALEILPKYKLQVKTQMIEKWKRKRLPIDDQSEECIDFVYSLIAK